MTEKFIPKDEKVASCIDGYNRVREAVAEAAVKSGRQPDSVRLMAVTKTVEPVYINAVLDAGAGLIGENKVQEYMGKRDELHLDGVEKHLIGHLQTNKAKYIVGEVDMIESVDSFKLAREIEKACVKKGCTQKVLIEVNIGGEESKSGISPDALETLLGQVAELPHVHICGLMTIPPVCDTQAQAGAYFEAMYKSFIDIKAKKLDNVNMDILSMGMSGDYETAVLCGSNLVRVGSAIFGARKYY